MNETLVIASALWVTGFGFGLIFLARLCVAAWTDWQASRARRRRTSAPASPATPDPAATTEAIDAVEHWFAVARLTWDWPAGVAVPAGEDAPR